MHLKSHKLQVQCKYPPNTCTCSKCQSFVVIQIISTSYSSECRSYHGSTSHTAFTHDITYYLCFSQHSSFGKVQVTVHACLQNSGPETWDVGSKGIKSSLASPHPTELIFICELRLLSVAVGQLFSGG